LIRKKYEEQKENHLSCLERLASPNAFVQKATDCVFEQMENAEFDVQQLAEYLCISRSQLHRKLTQLTGYSATQFIKRIRLEQAKDYLRDGTLNITEIAYRCGFNSQSYFSKSFQEYTGESPSQFVQRTKNGLNAT
jgi:AraC-like DNA-binding protein